MVNWFRDNKRTYPWRETEDPFRLLIAEIMLRRTKADQVKDVYEKVFQEYPDIDSLAKAEKGKIEEIVYPLGLKWRAPAFGLVVKELREQYGGKVPDTREKLTTLPGVGDYVAGAVLSVAYGKKEWIVDANVVRVFKRFFGIETSKEGRRDKTVIELAKAYVRTKNPREANLALLDFAALVCRPRNPKHDFCPLKANCEHFSQNFGSAGATGDLTTVLAPDRRRF